MSLKNTASIFCLSCRKIN